MRKIIVPLESVKHHEETLGKALIGYLDRLSQGKVLTWGENGKYQATKFCCRHYWQWVHEQFRDKHILTASPMVLFRFAKENKQKIKKIGIYCGKANNLCTDILEVTKKLFAYEKFRSGDVLVEVGKSGGKILWSEAEDNLKCWKGWSLAEYFRLLDIRYCPYCNAETVGLVKRTDSNVDGKDSYSAIDHILPKESYPLLALSLCNLVPTCYKCNSQYKRDKDLFMTEAWTPNTPLLALHPYVHNVHKWFRFKYEPTSVENMFVREEDKLSPLCTETQNPLPITKMKLLFHEQQDFYCKRVTNYLDVFGLPNSYRDLYAAEINEILKTEMICTQDFVDEMKSRYGLSECDFDLIFRRTSLHPREINQHRFAKLVIDLNDQFRQNVSRRKIISAWKKYWRMTK